MENNGIFYQLLLNYNVFRFNLLLIYIRKYIEKIQIN